MDNKKKVLFDPGYAPLVIDSIGQIGYTYYMFSAVPDKKLKRLNFPHVLKKIENLLKINVAFYLGCLLWGSRISQMSDCEIEGNKLLGEDAKEEEYTGEINFLIDFLERELIRDSKYYLNSAYVADKRYLPILKAYREFLIVNKGFTECKNTNEIVMPSSLKKPTTTELNLIEKNIENAIQNKDITQLFECFELLF